MRNPFRYFNRSPEVIRLAVMMYVGLPLSRRNVEDLLHECGIDISHQTVRCRFVPNYDPSSGGAKSLIERFDQVAGWGHDWTRHATPNIPNILE